MAHVAELVGDDQTRLGRREVAQERVVEHDALRVPQPAHVGVGRGGAARGVHLVDLAHVDAGLARQPQHVRAQLAGPDGGELVEERLEHDRAGVDADHGEGHDDGRAGYPPAPPGAPHAHDQQGAARTGEDRSDRLGAGDVGDPARPVLGHQPGVLGPLAGHGAQRQGREADHHGDRRRRRRAGEHGPADGHQPLGRAPHDEHERADAERHLTEREPRLTRPEPFLLAPALPH